MAGGQVVSAPAEGGAGQHHAGRSGLLAQQDEAAEEQHPDQVSEDKNGDGVRESQAELDAERSEHPVDRGEVGAGPDPELAGDFAGPLLIRGWAGATLRGLRSLPARCRQGPLGIFDACGASEDVWDSSRLCVAGHIRLYTMCLNIPRATRRSVMSIRLQDVLNHPTLAAADPIVRAAARAAARAQLRWIHSSEIIDIAPLLAGGELLLTGGEALALASEERQVNYIRQLAERGVAAVAIETGAALPSLPSSMVAAAEAAGLPLIELRGVVPFVGVMQAINSMLVSDSVSQLRRADEASHAMAVELAHGGGLDRILAVLAGIIHAEVTLTSIAGATLASASPGRAEAADADASTAWAAGAGTPDPHRRADPRHPCGSAVAPGPGGRGREPGPDGRKSFRGHPGPGIAAADVPRAQGSRRGGPASRD